MSDLLALAARCEASPGPDRELSAEIALAVHDWLHEVEGNKPLNCRVRNSYGSPVYIGGAAATTMDYTASLDAARQLYVRLPERVPSNPRLAAAEGLRQRAEEV